VTEQPDQDHVTLTAVQGMAGMNDEMARFVIRRRLIGWTWAVRAGGRRRYGWAPTRDRAWTAVDKRMTA
jgi:hypothetical protein